MSPEVFNPETSSSYTLSHLGRNIFLALKKEYNPELHSGLCLPREPKSGNQITFNLTSKPQFKNYVLGEDAIYAQPVFIIEVIRGESSVTLETDSNGWGKKIVVTSTGGRIELSEEEAAHNKSIQEIKKLLCEEAQKELGLIKKDGEEKEQARQKALSDLENIVFHS